MVTRLLDRQDIALKLGRYCRDGVTPNEAWVSKNRTTLEELGFPKPAVTRGDGAGLGTRWLESSVDAWLEGLVSPGAAPPSAGPGEEPDMDAILAANTEALLADAGDTR